MKPTKLHSILNHLQMVILLDIFFGEGAEVPVLVNVAVIGKTGEETAFI